MQSLVLSSSKSPRTVADREAPALAQVLDDNELRLDRLERHGVRLGVDPAALLEFFFERVIASRSAREFRLHWALNVAGLVAAAETRAVQ